MTLRRARGEERPLEVRVDDGAPVVVGHLEEQVVADDPCARHEDVEAPAARDGGRDRRLDIVAPGRVAAGREPARGRLGLVEFGAPDRRALRGESRRSRRADASRAAGDERRLPLEPHACGSVTSWYFARTSSTYAA